LEAFVDGVVREAMLQSHVPGVAVSVVQNGQVLLKKAYGVSAFAPRRLADPDLTLFRLGALSASFTWLEVMREVERGHMRLDAPVNLYLPEKLQVRDQGYAEPVRLRDLIDHASGFEERALGRLYERNPERVRPLDTYLRQERPRRVQAPGQRAEYVDYEAALAGEAVSQAAGQPFEGFVEADLLRPLGLGHTSFREPRPALAGLPAPLDGGLAQGVAQEFHWTGLGLEPRPYAYAGQIAPAAAASSTAADMARYMLLLLGGGTLDGHTFYGQQTAQALRTVVLSAGPETAGWTYGLKQQALPGGFEGLGLDGPSLSSHAAMTLAPTLGLGVFSAGNSEGAEDMAHRLPALIIEHFYAGAQGPPPARATDTAAQRQLYAGHYLSERRRYGGLEKFVDLLTRTATVGAGPDGLLVIRSSEGAGNWAPAAGHPGGFTPLSADSAVSLFDVRDGRAVRWFAPSGEQSFVRAGWFMRPAGLGWTGALALVASLATLIGLAVRDRRDFRQTAMQRRASALQTTASILWLLAACAFAVWGWGAVKNPAQSFFDWPGVFILIASACALVGALASLSQLLLLPAVWRGGRRLDSWTTGRKLSFTVTVGVFAGFSLLLALWGALEPWNN